jgi:imidazolonepropionase-like amidohydrolase
LGTTESSAYIRVSAAQAAIGGVISDEVIDAAGGTILPGLIDSHIHPVPGALAQGSPSV